MVSHPDQLAQRKKGWLKFIQPSKPLPNTFIEWLYLAYRHKTLIPISLNRSSRFVNRRRVDSQIQLESSQCTTREVFTNTLSIIGGRIRIKNLYYLAGNVPKTIA